MTAPQLKKLQSKFYAFVLHGRGRDQLIEQLRSPDNRRAVPRLDVYRNAYFIRLTGALSHDFPACERVLGRAEFARQAAGFIVACPSVSPSLRNLGNGFAGRLREHAGPAIADLADIEWAALQAADGPNVVPAKLSAMEMFAPDDWATLSVELVPTLTLLSLGSNADEVWLDKSKGTILVATAAKSIAISRNENFQPVLRVLDGGILTVLDALRQKISLAAVSEHVAKIEGVPAAPTLLAESLLIALAHGWIADVRTIQAERTK